MQKIIFRADGNNRIGLGHLYRIYALIEMYRSKYPCIIVCKNTSLGLIPSQYQKFGIPDSISLLEEAKWIESQFNSKDCIIIADGYNFDSTWQKEIKKAGFKLFYVDDFCRDEMYADVVINHALNILPEDYKAQSFTKFALGTKYAILRPAFMEAAKRTRKIDKYQSAFVCFGGADPLNLSLKAVKALLKFSTISTIQVVVGVSYRHQELNELSGRDSRVHLYKNLSETDLIQCMQKADFAIASASNILYELCAVKMPVLSGYYVDNQKKLYQGCLDNNLIFGMDSIEQFTDADFEKQIDSFLNSENKQQYVLAQSNLFDGNIKERFLNLLQELTYRKAEEKDVDLIYQWANDPLTRANSYNSEPILFQTHEKWFKSKLIDNNAFIFIAEKDIQPVGMIRYELKQDYAVVGILIDTAFRGRGFAVKMLKESAQLYFEKSSLPINAFIKESNLASIKSFEKAGYHFLRNEIVSDHNSVVYQLTKKDVQ